MALYPRKIGKTSRGTRDEISPCVRWCTVVWEAARRFQNPAFQFVIENNFFLKYHSCKIEFCSRGASSRITVRYSPFTIPLERIAFVFNARPVFYDRSKIKSVVLNRNGIPVRLIGS